MICLLEKQKKADNRAAERDCRPDPVGHGYPDELRLGVI
jgi:hypothetical protein